MLSQSKTLFTAGLMYVLVRKRLSPRQVLLSPLLLLLLYPRLTTTSTTASTTTTSSSSCSSLITCPPLTRAR